LTREEIDGFFKSCDSGGQSFLSLSDVQEAFRTPARPPVGANGPSKATLIRGLFRQEIGSLQPRTPPGATGPALTLPTGDGHAAAPLSTWGGSSPLALVSATSTGGPSRPQAGNVENLYRRYQDRAAFVMVYVREAHPTDGWTMESNDRAGVSIPQPRNYAE